MTVRRLLVSIHDVSPAFEAEVRRLWSLCRGLHITPALLVVPSWHGRWPIAAHPEFVQWIHECHREGAELFLHGLRHDEVGSPRGWRDHWRAVGRTAREAEFLTLDVDATETRVREGLARLYDVGLGAVGFVAPAWLAGAHLHEVVRGCGLPLSEDVARVYVHGAQRSVEFLTPVVRWSARSHLRAVLSHVVASLQHQRCTQRETVRVALHPQDLRHPLTAGSLRRSLARWTLTHHPTAYGSLA